MKLHAKYLKEALYLVGLSVYGEKKSIEKNYTTIIPGGNKGIVWDWVEAFCQHLTVGFIS